MGSTRLPGKILKNFYGDDTLLETLLNNLHKIEGTKIIVATSVNENNDKLETFLLNMGELVFRGSENDVLDRFIKAAEANNVDGIVRICSDNPFMDWHGVAELTAKAKASDADYIGFRINDKPSILTHFGFWGEFVTLDALKRVAATVEVGTPEHEHVTYHIYNHPNEYKCEWIVAPEYLQGRDDIRLTIDTFDDLTNALKVYSELKAQDENFTLQDVVNYLDAHEEIKQSMLKNIFQNKK
ncbi:spore coat polysaccharide biosynthesis protein SpsF [Bacteroides graminisolvens DSM 19988 = JCM 15093]|uniref:Spore coat polysaccharide biosynthesis protein SpsF n=2 Tax=Bacteroides graminisolvens TaxID=477666 RepID=A0A069CZS3_9BACE|nr:spore coat polysaccharide biosynthesis protein SpsF [Bacteroides graminisolvens DSM 19988 = JCM 15093]